MKIYSASEITLIFALIPIDGGRGDDEFVTISRAEETFSYKAGIDGEGTRSDCKNNLYKVKVTLMQTSAMNGIFSAIYNADVALPGGAGVSAILIRDKQGKNLFASAQAWITKPGDLKYGKEAGTIEWEIDVHNPDHFIGGN